MLVDPTLYNDYNSKVSTPDVRRQSNPLVYLEFLLLSLNRTIFNLISAADTLTSSPPSWKLSYAFLSFHRFYPSPAVKLLPIWFDLDWCFPT